MTTQSHLLPPDAQEHRAVAISLAGGPDSPMTLLRTPGFPMLVWAAARSSGEDWRREVPDGFTARVVLRVVLFHYILGALIPVLVYASFYLASARVWIALVCSSIYAWDLPSLTFQSMVLSETLSFASFWLAALLALALIRRRQMGLAVACGLAVGAAVLVRPQLAIIAIALSGLALGLAVLLRVRQGHHPAARDLAIAAGFAAACITLPLGWMGYNWSSQGHFVFSLGAGRTLSNWSARHFVTLESDDPHFAVLRRELRRALQQGEHHAGDRAQQAVQEELGLDDYEYHSLLGRAARFTILRRPLSYLGSAWQPYRRSWGRPFRWHTHASTRARELWPFGFLAREDGAFVAGNWTLAALLLCSAAAIFLADTRERRAMLAFLLMVALGNALVAALLDEAEVRRHALATRLLVNGLILAGGAAVIERWAWPQLRRLVGASTVAQR